MKRKRLLLTGTIILSILFLLWPANVWSTHPQRPEQRLNILDYSNSSLGNNWGPAVGTVLEYLDWHNPPDKLGYPLIISQLYPHNRGDIPPDWYLYGNFGGAVDQAVWHWRALNTRLMLDKKFWPVFNNPVTDNPAKEALLNAVNVMSPYQLEVSEFVYGYTNVGGTITTDHLGRPNNVVNPCLNLKTKYEQLIRAGCPVIIQFVDNAYNWEGIAAGYGYNAEGSAMNLASLGGNGTFTSRPLEYGWWWYIFTHFFHRYNELDRPLTDNYIRLICLHPPTSPAVISSSDVTISSSGTATVVANNPVTFKANESIEWVYDIVNYEWWIDNDLVSHGPDAATFNYTFPTGSAGQHSLALVVFDERGVRNVTRITVNVEAQYKADFNNLYTIGPYSLGAVEQGQVITLCYDVGNTGAFNWTGDTYLIKAKPIMVNDVLCDLDISISTENNITGLVIGEWTGVGAWYGRHFYVKIRTDVLPLGTYDIPIDIYKVNEGLWFGDQPGYTGSQPVIRLTIGASTPNYPVMELIDPPGDIISAAPGDCVPLTLRFSNPGCNAIYNPGTYFVSVEGHSGVYGEIFGPFEYMDCEHRIEAIPSPFPANYSTDREITLHPTVTSGSHELTICLGVAGGPWGNAAQITKTFRINAPPILHLPTSQRVREGEHLSFEIYASDIDTATPICGVESSMPEGTSLFREGGNPGERRSQASFNWYPNPDQSGEYDITFYADDGNPNGYVTRTVHIIVEDNPNLNNSYWPGTIVLNPTEYYVLTGLWERDGKTVWNSRSAINSNTNPQDGNIFYNLEYIDYKVRLVGIPGFYYTLKVRAKNKPEDGQLPDGYSFEVKAYDVTDYYATGGDPILLGTCDIPASDDTYIQGEIPLYITDANEQRIIRLVWTNDEGENTNIQIGTVMFVVDNTVSGIRMWEKHNIVDMIMFYLTPQEREERQEEIEDFVGDITSITVAGGGLDTRNRLKDLQFGTLEGIRSGDIIFLTEEDIGDYLILPRDNPYDNNENLVIKKGDFNSVFSISSSNEVFALSWKEHVVSSKYGTLNSIYELLIHMDEEDIDGNFFYRAQCTDNGVELIRESKVGMNITDIAILSNVRRMLVVESGTASSPADKYHYIEGCLTNDIVTDNIVTADQAIEGGKLEDLFGGNQYADLDNDGIEDDLYSPNFNYPIDAITFEKSVDINGTTYPCWFIVQGDYLYISKFNISLTAKAQNLLPNNSFESSQPTTDYTIVGTKASSLSTYPYDGTYSAQVTIDGIYGPYPGGFYIGGLRKKYVVGEDIEPGATYRLSAWLMSEDDFDKLCVRATTHTYDYDEEDGIWEVNSRNTYGPTVACDGVWYESSLTFTTPSKDELSKAYEHYIAGKLDDDDYEELKEVVLYVGYGTSLYIGSTFYIDNVILEKVEDTETGINRLPYFDPEPHDMTVDEGEEATQTLTAVDLDGDQIEIYACENEYSSLPGFATLTWHEGIPGYYTLEITPGFYDSGSYEVTLDVKERDNPSLESNAPVEITITVNDVNRPPVIENQYITIPEGSSVNITLSATDLDGDSLTYTIETQPVNGTLSGDAPNLTYTPDDPNYAGLDGFTCTVTDGNGGTDTATVTVRMCPVNDLPVAQDDAAETNEDEAVIIDVLLNDNDIDIGDVLSVLSVTPPSNGIAVINADNTITYTPDDDFNGVDSFTYIIIDTSGATATATVTVIVKPINDAPALDLIEDKFIYESGTLTFTVTATDPDVGDSLIYSASNLPQGANFNSDNQKFEWTPGYEQAGIYEVTFKVIDEYGLEDSETITITVISIPVISISLEGPDPWELSGVRLGTERSNVGTDGECLHKIRNTGNVNVEVRIKYPNAEDYSFVIPPEIAPGENVFVTYVGFDATTRTAIPKQGEGMATVGIVNAESEPIDLPLTYVSPTNLTGDYADITGMSAAYEIRAYPTIE